MFFFKQKTAYEMRISDWSSDLCSSDLAWHKWAGVSLLVLIVVRLAWRMSHKAPEFPLAMKPMARLAAHAAHWLLYALMLAIPLSGWLMSSAQGFQVEIGRASCRERVCQYV